MYEFSTTLKNKELYCKFNKEFIEFCKKHFERGLFSTYMDGEPVFFSRGQEVSYRMFLEWKRNNKDK